MGMERLGLGHRASAQTKEIKQCWKQQIALALGVVGFPARWQLEW